MPTVVNIHEAKTHLSRLLERALAGEEIVVAKAGRPLVRLAPVGEHATERRPGRLTGRLSEAFFEPLPPDALADWEGR
ncbi:MAG: type II toxin-antitoxin system Phd/YefM family antitoxin [Rubrivivax sp.]